MLGNCMRLSDWKDESSNDFEAVAYSLPSLAPPDLVGIGGGKAEPGAPMAVTGKRVKRRLPGARGRKAHSHFERARTCNASRRERREDEIIKHLRSRFGHVSAERVVSGDGLENIYQAIVALDGLALAPRSAADITSTLTGDCPVAHEALATFCAFWVRLPETWR